jgi:hypothetical protein
MGAVLHLFFVGYNVHQQQLVLYQATRVSLSSISGTQHSSLTGVTNVGHSLFESSQIDYWLESSFPSKVDTYSKRDKTCNTHQVIMPQSEMLFCGNKRVPRWSVVESGPFTSASRSQRSPSLQFCNVTKRQDSRSCWRKEFCDSQTCRETDMVQLTKTREGIAWRIHAWRFVILHCTCFRRDTFQKSRRHWADSTKGRHDPEMAKQVPIETPDLLHPGFVCLNGKRLRVARATPHQLYFTWP